MRALLCFIAVLATFQFVVAGTTEDSTATQSTHTASTHAPQPNANSQQSNVEKSSPKNDERLPSGEEEVTAQPDHETQIKIEKNLLTLFGMSKRPKPIDRSKIVIPEAMKMLYAEIMGEELRESVNLPKPGLHTKSANTVRSFTHEGNFTHFDSL